MQVDFYVVDSHAPAQRTDACCRLAQKAYRAGASVYVRTTDEACARALDDALWTFRQGSFIPHALAERANGEPVLIGTGEPPEPPDLFINLTDDLPGDWQRYPRLAEVVIQAPSTVTPARERFRAYKAAGVTPRTHELEARDHG